MAAANPFASFQSNQIKHDLTCEPTDMVIFQVTKSVEMRGHQERLNMQEVGQCGSVSNKILNSWNDSQIQRRLTDLLSQTTKSS